MFFAQLCSHSNVVMRCSILRCPFNAFFVPNNGLSMLFLSSISNSYVIGSPNIVWKFLRDHFELVYLLIWIAFVSCQDIMGVHIVFIHLQYLLRHFHRLTFFDPPVLREHGNANIIIDDLGLDCNHLFIVFKSFFIPASSVENIRVTDIEFVTLMRCKGIFIPDYSLLCRFDIGASDVAIAK